MARPLLHPRLLPRLEPTFFSSRCTIEAGTDTLSASGHPTTAWAAVGGLVSVPCAVGPAPFQFAGERRLEQLTVAEATHRIALAGAFPSLAAISSRMRAVVVGTNAGIYDITRAETDSDGALTYLDVRAASPAAVAGA